MNEEFDNYKVDDEEEEDISSPQYTLWQIVPRIMVSPQSGLKKLRQNGPSPELAAARFLLPLCLLTGFSAFFSYLYPGQIVSFAEENNFSVILVNAVVQFCAFFLGYYVAVLMARVFLPKGIRYFTSTKYGKLLTMTAIGTLAFFHIVCKALPMFDSFLVFLPLWTIFIIYKGMEPIAFDSDKKLLAIGTMCLITIVSPTLIAWILVLFT